MNRCLNNLFGYCDTTPSYKDTPTKKTVFDYQGRPFEQSDFTQYCQFDRGTCDHHLSYQESLAISHPTLCPLDVILPPAKKQNSRKTAALPKKG